MCPVWYPHFWTLPWPLPPAVPMVSDLTNRCLPSPPCHTQGVLLPTTHPMCQNQILGISLFPEPFSRQKVWLSLQPSFWPYLKSKLKGQKDSGNRARTQEGVERSTRSWGCVIPSGGIWGSWWGADRLPRSLDRGPSFWGKWWYWLSELLLECIFLSPRVCLCEDVQSYMCVCVSVSVYMTVFLCVCISVSVFLYLCLRVCISVCLCVFISVCLCVCISVSQCVCVSVNLFVCAYNPVSLYRWTSVCLCIPVCLCVPYLCVCVFLYLCEPVAHNLTFSPGSETPYWFLSVHTACF